MKSQCDRCKDWEKMGLSNTCPGCDLEAENMTSQEICDNVGEFSGDKFYYGFLAGLKYARENPIEDKIAHAFAVRANLFKSILELLDEVGVDDTIDWIRGRGKFEISMQESRTKEQSK